MEEIYNIKFKEDIPKYIQVAGNIKKLIESRQIKDGEKLPTIRELSNTLKVNKFTIVNAYKKLKVDGYAYQKVGSGTYAKRKETISSFNREYSKSFKELSSKDLKDIIDFTGETNSDVYFPIEDFKHVINEVLDRDGANALIAKESLGYENLRNTINKAFWNDELDLNNILIVSGAQQGIDIASKAIVNINDNVVVEKPTYGGAISVFKWRRANIFELNLENDGANLQELEEILKKNNISCFYTMSYFHNPTGISYSLEKKIKLLELAKKYDFYIIEDDYLSELIYDNDVQHQPLKSLDKYERVIYIKSFSKIFLPGIRLGYMIAPSSFNESIQSSKINTDISTSSLMQRALELYINEGLWKKSIDYQQKMYKEKYLLMKELINKELSNKVSYIDPKGGLYFYLEIKNKSINSKELFYRLKKKNLFITPGAILFKDSSNGDYYFRISFSQASKEKIVEGINLIKEELK